MVCTAGTLSEELDFWSWVLKCQAPRRSTGSSEHWLEKAGIEPALQCKMDVLALKDAFFFFNVFHCTSQRKQTLTGTLLPVGTGFLKIEISEGLEQALQREQAANSTIVWVPLSDVGWGGG